ncbi:MAG: hypothetical protein WAS27_00180 [Candidatus Saccharimonadales bacterium]
MAHQLMQSGQAARFARAIVATAIRLWRIASGKAACLAERMPPMVLVVDNRDCTSLTTQTVW